MFEELKKFKDREGHCNVTSSYSENPELGKWVSWQRRQRLKMSKERGCKLDSIGFTWGADQDIQWEIMFEELRKFKDTECHCNVPVRFSDNPKLGTWVHSQRSKRLKISKERASKLDSIGFTWGADQDIQWEIMLEELRKFKDTECHCNVPVRFSYNPKLGRWVDTQRRQRLIISK